MYAGTPTGIFKSTDGGGSWSSSLTNAYVQILAIAPTTPTTLFAAGQGGIYKSTDSGTSWNAVNNGLENQNGPIYILALAIDPTNANIVYAAGPDIDDPTVTYKAIYKSTDGGGSWSFTKHSIRSFAVHHALAIDPVNSNIIYAAGSVGNGTVWKSTDNGRSWSIVDVGFDGRSTVYALAIDPTNPNIIYVGTQSLGVYKSSDGGGTWSVFRDGLQVDPNDASNFFGVSALAIDPGNASIVFAGTYGGVFKSISGGPWSALNSGLTNLGVNALALDPSNPTNLLTGTGVGIFRSTSAGASWSAANKGLRGVNVSSLAVNPGNANVYAGTDGATSSSSNNGGSWAPNDFYPLAFDHHNPNIVFARLTGRDGLFRSADGGATWSIANSGLENNSVSGVVIDPRNSDVIYADTNGSLFKSMNSGASWSAIGDLFCPQFLVIDPNNSQILYAASSYGCDDYCSTVFKSTDGGVSWARSDTGASFFYLAGLAIDPINTATLYAFEAGNIYKSIDAGGSWNRIGAELPTNSINSLVVDPLDPSNLYLGIHENGVFKSADAGATWNPFNDGLTNLNVNILAIGAAGSFLHAGTPVGVFDIQLSPTTPRPNTVQFSSASYSVSEDSPRVDITLTRSGDTTSSASVILATNDGAGLTNCNVTNGIASPRCDYENTIVTATWAAGDATAKSFSIAVVDDSYVEGNETFTISLNSPSGATLGAQSTATVTITDNDSSNGTNPIDSTNFFVRQQYIDFLGREPDPDGFNGWVSTINNCSGDTTQCDRIHVSQLFFQSAEFQDRGYFVYRFYPVAFGRKPDYSEFVTDLARVSGFLDASQLEAAKVAFIADFMARPAFVSQYNSLSNTAYVDALINTAAVNSPNRQALIDALTNNTATRAQVLRQIVESSEVSTKYNHQAFAVMEYFGYLRRQPDVLYLDWITALDTNNDPRGMVTGFVSSAEYRNRFGP
jgi:photosystem II stability/assembly factor-like uncharacterized protein